MSAVAAAKQGHRVALIDINAHVGGMVSGGLVATDIGDRKTVGGLAKEFFDRVVTYYRNKYGEASIEFKACRGGLTFEPHIAELVFQQMIDEQPNIQLWRRHRYRATEIDSDRATAGRRVIALQVDDLQQKTTRRFLGEVFVDASYEGDLMAGAQVPYRIGREARDEYGEQLAGISRGPIEIRGMGDHRTQAYNYRVSITSKTENRVLFPRPEHYDPSPFVNTDGRRIIEGKVKGFGDFFTTIDKAHPNAKYDANWGDYPGNSEGYADGDWETRDRIAKTIRERIQSRLYYVQNDPSLPEAFRREAQTWGLPADEFTDNGHFPFQLYVREGRRMVGKYVLRERDLTQDRWKYDGVATGSYGIDCHIVQMLREEGKLVPEHTQHVACNNYDIPYRSLVPHDVSNLLVPVCISATHVAYCSVRMEPVYMMLGQAAGEAANLAITNRCGVEAISVADLRTRLQEQGAILDAGYQPQVQIIWTPQYPRPGEKVIFKAVPQKTNRDGFKQVLWNFSGDGKVDAEGERVVHQFDHAKQYAVSLLVEDSAGRRRLVEQQVAIGNAEPLDVTLDDFDAELYGRWNGTIPEYIPGLPLRYSDIYSGAGIHRDMVVRGKVIAARARFVPDLLRAGRYQVCLAYRPAKVQATNTPITIRHAGGTAKVVLNQQQSPTALNYVSLGEFEFAKGREGFLEVTNRDADGRVAIDGARWIWLGE